MTEHFKEAPTGPQAEFWQTPSWRWWWSPLLFHQRSVIQNWLPAAQHYEIQHWAPDHTEDLPILDCFVLTAREIDLLRPAHDGYRGWNLNFILVDPQADVPARLFPNSWLIPWRLEQGVQHPRLIRLIQEFEAGVRIFRPGQRDEQLFQQSPLATWLNENAGRIVAHRGPVILAEVSDQPFLARILAEQVCQVGQQHGVNWEIAGTFEIHKRPPVRWSEWLQPPRGRRRRLIIFFGNEEPLTRMQDSVRSQETYWCWLPRPSQLTHTWPALLELFPRDFTWPMMWTRWAWQKFCYSNWPDNLGAILLAWDRLVRLASHQVLVLTGQRMQLLTSGNLPTEAPEPLANLVISMIHERLRSGADRDLMRVITGAFEKIILEVATRTFPTFQDALRFLGLSRATAMKKMEAYGITNPWLRTERPARFEEPRHD